MAYYSWGSWAGPGSQFRVYQGYGSTGNGAGTDNGSGYTVTAWRAIYVYVPPGGSGFRGTNVSTNYGGTVTLYKSKAGITSFNRTPSYGGTVNDGYIWAQYTGGSGTTYKSQTGNISYTAPRQVITMDVNGYLDGTTVGNTSGYGTFDVYINGSLISNDVTDYYNSHYVGETYSISGISATTGHQYNGVQSGSLSGTFSGNTKVALNFTTKTIKLTLAKNGGSGGTSTVYYKYGTNKFYSNSACTTEITSITPPTRAGYTFVQYNGDGTVGGASGERYIYNDGTFASDLCTDIHSNATLTAQWSANSQTLKVDPSGGSWGGTTAVSTKTGTTGSTLSIAVPTRTGHTFGGWYKTAYGSLNNSTSQNPLFTSSSPLPYVYNNAGDGTVTHTRQSDTSAGYTHTIKITTSNTSAYPGSGGFYTETSSAASQTFIHVFRAKVPVGYSLYHAANAVGAGSTFTWLTDNAGTGAWKNYAYKLTCGSSGPFSTFGFIFIEQETVPVTWYLGGTQITKTPTSAQTFTFGAGTTTLYAQWIPNRYYVKYNANGGSGSMNNTTHYYGIASTLRTNTFTRPGYKFLGWSTNASATSASYTDGSSISTLSTVNEGTVNLYAVWQKINNVTMSFNSPSYTITNDSNGKASLSNLNFTYTLSGVDAGNSSENFWFTPYYNQSSLTKRGPIAINSLTNNSGTFTLTAAEIKDYLQKSHNTDKIEMSINAWTSIENNDSCKTTSSLSSTINNYTKPKCEVLTAHRLSNNNIYVKARIIYPASYSNLGNVTPILKWGTTTLGTVATVKQISTNVYEYIYEISASSANGASTVSIYYTDDIFDSTGSKRVAASAADQIFKIIKSSGICYAFEFIET